MEISIQSIMDEEHKRILDLLLKFEKEKHNEEKRDEIFQKFKWSLEKHFFLEEKAIFSVYGSITGQEVSDIFELMEEHGTIIEMIKGLEQVISSGKDPNISLLRETLEKHSDFEDSTFYPRMDRELSQEQKQEIADRAKEILRG